MYYDSIREDFSLAGMIINAAQAGLTYCNQSWYINAAQAKLTSISIRADIKSAQLVIFRS